MWFLVDDITSLQTILHGEALDEAGVGAVLDVLEHQALVVEFKHDTDHTDDARVTQLHVNRSFAFQTQRHATQLT